jgi:sugar transferase (PEP-CTERM system associated)
MHRILRHYVATSWVLFGAFEAALIAIGCAAAFPHLFPHSDLSGARLTALAIVLSLGIVALMHSGGLYEGNAVLNFKRTLWRIAVITVPIFALAVWTTGALAKHTTVPIYPYRWQWTVALTGAWLISALLLRVALQQIYRSGVLTRRVLVVGPSNQAAELAELARQSDQRFRLVAQFDPQAENDPERSHTSLALMASSLHASEIVIAIGAEPPPWSVLAHCRVAGIRVTDYLDFYEREGRRIRVDSLREDWIALSGGFAAGKSNDRLRRLTDVLFAVVGFIATAPVLLLTALAIKLGDGGPILYCQERVGLNGAPFTIFKFRSMREDAESDGQAAWAAERDHRITPVGRIIRKLRIDELPQFWNVLRGDMSLIGPRPERSCLVHQFSPSIPFYDYRHAVRPGITGWAQVSFRYGASLEDTRRKLSYDLYYIKNRSILLDCVILLKTVSVVVRGEGAR